MPPAGPPGAGPLVDLAEYAEVVERVAVSSEGRDAPDPNRPEPPRAEPAAQTPADPSGVLTWNPFADPDPPPFVRNLFGL